MPSSRICILDAGPLIHLDELGALGLRAELGQVFTTATVAGEVEKHRPGTIERSEIVVVRDVKTTSLEVRNAVARYDLQAGEMSALAWGQAFGIDLFVSDDSDARDAAAVLGHPSIGTIGVILENLRAGRMEKSAAVQLLEAIPARSTLHIRSRFLEEALSRLR